MRLRRAGPVVESPLRPWPEASSTRASVDLGASAVVPTRHRLYERAEPQIRHQRKRSRKFHLRHPGSLVEPQPTGHQRQEVRRSPTRLHSRWPPDTVEDPHAGHGASVVRPPDRGLCGRGRHATSLIRSRSARVATTAEHRSACGPVAAARESGLSARLVSPAPSARSSTRCAAAVHRSRAGRTAAAPAAGYRVGARRARWHAGRPSQRRRRGVARQVARRRAERPLAVDELAAELAADVARV